jgi:CRP-like cAMP-binding protein
MFPESLHLVLANRSEFQPGHLLPLTDGSEPLAYALLSGCIVLANVNGDTASVYWPGDLVVAPVERAGATRVLRAIADSVCMRGRCSDLLMQCARQLELTRWVWEQNQSREAELLNRMELLTKGTVERRVLHTVADLADRSNAASPGIPMPLAQNEIAELAGATRETTSTLLNRMRRRGIVELGRRRIQVPVPDLLRSLSGLAEAAAAGAAGAEPDLMDLAAEESSQAGM